MGLKVFPAISDKFLAPWRTFELGVILDFQKIRMSLRDSRRLQDSLLATALQEMRRLLKEGDAKGSLEVSCRPFGVSTVVVVTWPLFVPHLKCFFPFNTCHFCVFFWDGESRYANFSSSLFSVVEMVLFG